MLSSKLKITVCVAVLALLALAGASGVAYRAVAQETKQAAPTSRAAGQSATGDLEALRREIKALRREIEALRNALPATRERVKTPENKEQPRREGRKIIVTTPQAKDVTVTQQYACQIHSRRHINVRSLQDGYLEEVSVKEGQAVKKGDVMFKIVPVLYRARYEAAMAEAQLAQLELNNAKKLFEDKVASSREVALFEAKLAKAKAHAKLAEAELNFTVIRAPFDGLIDRLREQTGSLVRGRDVLTTLSDNSVVWVYFNVPEARYLEYMAGPGREKEAPRIELVLANGSKFPRFGKIGAVEAVFNNGAGSIPFRADFENPNGLLRHGQTGNVLIHRTLNNAIVIPQRATFEVLDKRYVYVVDKDGVAHQREVVVQNELDDLFVIKRGLNVDDRIVLEGARQVRDGEKVEFEFRKPEQHSRRRR